MNIDLEKLSDTCLSELQEALVDELSRIYESEETLLRVAGNLHSLNNEIGRRRKAKEEF